MLGFLALARRTEAQVYYYGDGSDEPVMIQMQSGATGTPGTAGKGDGTKPPTTPRGQKLMQLIYDRRPSAILAARAKPEGAPETPADSAAALGAEQGEALAGVEGELAQLAVNAEEAKHSSIFVAGWRPAICASVAAAATMWCGTSHARWAARTGTSRAYRSTATA
ncbi:MAG: hypothetical protein ABL998_22390 [Planctomycetota bacterium]